MTADTAAGAPEFDVVVAGGGLVGGSLAVALAQTGLQVALVEAVAPDAAAQPSFDERTIALSHGSCTILRQLGVWEHLLNDIWPVEQIHVSEQGRFGTTLIDAREQGLAQLGYVIQARALGRALWTCVAASPTLTALCPARVTAVEPAEQGRRLLHLEHSGDAGPAAVAARLLVVADGARSALRESLGISAAERDYEQVAVIAKVQVDPRRAGTRAFERFTPSGPLALLPGPAARYTAVLALPAASAEALLQSTDCEFLEHLQALCGFRLGRLRRVGRRAAYPLKLVTAARLTADRAVLVGNAANSLHPVAGQGFNLGLRDIASLAELLQQAQAVAPEADPGAADVLAAYAQWRAADQRNVVRFTDGLIRFFGSPGGALSATRGLGLAFFDLSPPAKRALAEQTMGLAGRMTRLARGLAL